MFKKTTILAFAATLALGACAGIDTDGERALVGAAGGALAASATGNDTTTGALAGATAGALCDDVNICR